MIMAMRPSTLLFLLTVAIVVASISSKRILRKGKVNPGKNKESAKNKDNLKNKADKKKVVEEESEESSEYVYSDEEKKKESHIEEDEEEEEDTTPEEEESEEDTDKLSGEEKYGEERLGVLQDESEEEDESLSASEEFKGKSREDLEEKGIFYSLKSIKAFLTQPMYQEDAEIIEVLKRFNHSEVQAHEKHEAYKNKPLEAFYVVDGVNPDTRRKVAQTLAHRLKGLYLVNQPRILLGPIPKESGAKKAYFALSKYAIANKILISLYHKPVIVENYWIEHASYIMAKLWDKAVKLPSPNTDVYEFPDDLLRPNVTFAIFNSPPPRIGRSPTKTYLREQRQLLVYKRVTGAKVYVVRFPESAKHLSDKVDMFLLNQGPRKTPVSFEITLAE
ncbi:uncharacterized protein LOC129004222 [Macrosteles quadrilineatus]|uniref:uncharacterized protein LOC129004222 n=1 Tax=Macrosteles quadrilineatus TaxID=74068 RepID=UPI0023E1D19D|nr:uncharacterized protein LOC129004222 [Macrosteles quadrilineatus]